jgi:perosamine synthetase
MNEFKFFDFKVSEAERRAVLGVLDRAWLRQGPETKRFEEEICKLTGSKYAVATSSGTGALHLSLLALGIRGKVLVPSLTFPATSNVIVNSGGTPIFVDIDPRIYTIDPDEIERVVKKDEDITAIMPVHIFGMPAEMDRIRETAEVHDLRIIEDCAQAFGAAYKKRSVGLWGDTGCFSFDTVKPFTSGEGGVLITDRKDVADKARSLKDHGRDKEGRFSLHGLNYKPTDMQISLLNAQLQGFDDSMKKRRALFEHYSAILDGMGIKTPKIAGHVRHAYTYFTAELPYDAEVVRENLKKMGIEAKTYPPVHLEPAYASYRKSLPVTEDVCKRLLSPPLHNFMDIDDIEHVADVLENVLKRFV